MNDNPRMRLTIVTNNGSSVSTTTRDLDPIGNIGEAIARYHRRTWFRRAPAVILINGSPAICVNINQIAFATCEASL
jgi:hypothetical protein